MATLQQLDPTAKVYPKPHFDWRRTHIHIGEGAAESQPYARDAALTDFDQRKKFHAVLDRACSKGNVTADRAQQLHARLDRLLDEQPDFFHKLLNEEEIEPENEEELPLIDLAADEPSETQKTNKQETGRDDRPEVAMDAGKCGSACRIQDNPVPARKTPALDAAHNSMADTVIGFWRQYGVNLQKAG